MTSPFEPQPSSPSLAEFAWAVRDENIPLANEFAIRTLEAHFDDILANQPEVWTPNGRHAMLLRQTCKPDGKTAATAGSITEVRGRNTYARRYRVQTYDTSDGQAYQHTAEWGKGDERMILVSSVGNTACGTSYSDIMPVDLIEKTVMHAHPEVTEIVLPTGFKAFVRRLGILGVRTLIQSQSRHPGITRPFGP